MRGPGRRRGLAASRRRVSTGFRARLIEHGLAERALELLLARLAELGLVKAGGRQRTDSTHVLAAVRSLNRLEILTETPRLRSAAFRRIQPSTTPCSVRVQPPGREHA